MDESPPDHFLKHPVATCYIGIGTHNPLVPGSSPGGPITSHNIHGVMVLRSRDQSPLVYAMAECMHGEFPGPSDAGRESSIDSLT